MYIQKIDDKQLYNQGKIDCIRGYAHTNIFGEEYTKGYAEQYEKESIETAITEEQFDAIED